MRRTAPRTSAANQGTKVTDYFTRRAAGGNASSSRTKDTQQQQLSKGSDAKTGVKTVDSKATPALEREVISVSSDSHISVSSGSIIYVAKSPKGPRTRRRAAAASTADASLQCIKQRASGRVRVSDIPLSAKASQILKPYITPQHTPAQSSPEKSKLSVKRKKKFDTDSDVEILSNVVYVPKAVKSKPVTPTPVFHVSTPIGLKSKEMSFPPKQTRTPPKKKQRLSTSDPNTSETMDMVPSSQSDEQEFETLPKLLIKSPEELSGFVSKWREGTSALPEDLSLAQDELPLPSTATDDFSAPVPEVDMTNPITEDSAPSSATLSDSLLVTSFMTCPGTPPVEKSSESQVVFGPFPATPVALDTESKTAQIIAQIKANAFQARFPSPESDILPDFSDLEDSSDESNDGLPAWRQPSLANADRQCRGPFSSPLSSLPDSPAKVEERAHSPSPFRYARRLRNAVVLKKRVGSVATSFKPPVKKGVKGKRLGDPLDMLLSEKKRAEKSGKGTEALLQAEAAVEDWTNEEAALAAVREGRDLTHTWDESLFGSPAGSISGSLLEAEERVRLLGEERGNAIASILVNDKKKKAQQTAPIKVLGVSLWIADWWQTDERMDKTPELRTCSSSVTDVVHPLIKALRGDLESNQIAHARLLINCGVLAAPFRDLTGITTFLLDLALSVHPIAESALHILLHHLGNERKASIPLSFVLQTIFRLGGEPSVFEKIGWILPQIQSQKTTFHARANIVHRLVIILTAAARASALSYLEIPDFLMVLQLLSIDPLTGADTRRDVMTAIDTVCQSLDHVTGGAEKIEIEICNKLLGFASDLAPINLVLFLSSFAGGGHPRTLRIARWLAHCMLVQTYSITSDQYCDLPPLSRLIDLLSLATESSEGLFRIDNETDYEDLGYYVDILSIALSNIEDHVAEESRTSFETPASQDGGGGSPKKGEKSKPLQIIRNHLDSINSEIVDTRAAYLERSRTKAALHRLALRIYYQRLSFLNSGDGLGKPRTLLTWIKK